MKRSGPGPPTGYGESDIGGDYCKPIHLVRALLALQLLLLAEASIHGVPNESDSHQRPCYVDSEADDGYDELVRLSRITFTQGPVPFKRVRLKSRPVRLDVDQSLQRDDEHRQSQPQEAVTIEINDSIGSDPDAIVEPNVVQQPRRSGLSSYKAGTCGKGDEQDAGHSKTEISNADIKAKITSSYPKRWIKKTPGHCWPKSRYTPSGWEMSPTTDTDYMCSIADTVTFSVTKRECELNSSSDQGFFCVPSSRSLERSWTDEFKESKEQRIQYPSMVKKSSRRHMRSGTSLFANDFTQKILRSSKSLYWSFGRGPKIHASPEFRQRAASSPSLPTKGTDWHLAKLVLARGRTRSLQRIELVRNHVEHSLGDPTLQCSRANKQTNALTKHGLSVTTTSKEMQVSSAIRMTEYVQTNLEPRSNLRKLEVLMIPTGTPESRKARKKPTKPKIRTNMNVVDGTKPSRTVMVP
jgi:hypothetical protein